MASRPRPESRVGTLQCHSRPPKAHGSYLANPQNSLFPYENPGKWPRFNKSWEAQPEDGHLPALKNMIIDLRANGQDGIEVARDFIVR